ncbi:MAG TPA: hypothetical protein VLS91_02260 [Acidimicrobiales bacterium]|nr:hypothetical protein [Acidimicrobiales bacterium]
MNGEDASGSLTLRVGEMSRRELLSALGAFGVRLNAAASELLDGAAFDHQEKVAFRVVQRTLAQLGFANGAVMSSIVARAHDVGLSLCPAITGPYLRLALANQESAPDAVMSNGSAPSGSITVAAVAPEGGEEMPRGFYVRAVNGVLWLRGYHASDEHVWSPDDHFAFRLEGPSPELGASADVDRANVPSGA